MTTSRGSDVAHVGARVMTADGKQLGTVKEVRADRFLVDVRWAPDYWLSTDVIGDGSQEVLQLTVTKSEIGSAKLHGRSTGYDRDMEGPSPFNRPPPSL